RGLTIVQSRRSRRRWGLLGPGRGPAVLIHLAADLQAVGIGLRIRHVLFLALFFGLVDAAGVNGLVVGVLGLLALLVVGLGDVVLDGLGRRGRDTVGRRVIGGVRDVRGGAGAGAAGVRRFRLARRLDELRARDPL